MQIVPLYSPIFLNEINKICVFPRDVFTNYVDLLFLR